MGRVLTRVTLAFALTASTGGYAAAGASAAEGASCASDNGVITLSPGLTGLAKAQRITAKGTLGECTGSTGASAKYVVHMKTAGAESCTSLVLEGGAASGTAAIKWGKKHGTSMGTFAISGSPSAGLSLSAAITAGPYAGLGVSTMVSAVPLFTGTGSPCTATNPLKTIVVTGTSPFLIS